MTDKTTTNEEIAEEVCCDISFCSIGDLKSCQRKIVKALDAKDAALQSERQRIADILRAYRIAAADMEYQLRWNKNINTIVDDLLALTSPIAPAAPEANNDPYKILFEGAFNIILNANDTFGYACADAHKIDMAGMIIAERVCKKYGHDGLTALMAFERGYEPLDELLTKKYRAARKEIDLILAEWKEGKMKNVYERYMEDLKEKRKDPGNVNNKYRLPKYRVAIHPGKHLKEHLQETGMTQTILAKKIGIGRSYLNHLLKGKRGISAEIAILLSRYFKTSIELWMNLQNNHELTLALKRMKKKRIKI